MNFDGFLQLLRNSLRQPELALRQLHGLNLPVSARWMALVVLVSLSSIMATLVMRAFPFLGDGGMNLPEIAPIPRAALQFVGIALAAWLIATVGRAFGGRGSFGTALLVVMWLETVLLVAQVVQLLIMLLFPLGGSVLGLIAVLAVMWMSVQLIKALHGFSSAGLVFLGMLATGLMTLMFLSVLAGALGVLPDPSAGT